MHMNPDSSPMPQEGQYNLPPVAASGTVPAGMNQAVPPAAPAGSSAVLTPEQLKQYAVEQARKIVEANQTDPYTKARALDQLKTQYLQDRYHQVINTAGQ